MKIKQTGRPNLLLNMSNKFNGWLFSQLNLFNMQLYDYWTELKQIHTWCIRISCEWHVVNSRSHNENYGVLCHCVFCLHRSLTLWPVQWLISKSHYINSNLHRHNSETKDDTHTHNDKIITHSMLWDYNDDAWCKQRRPNLSTNY